MLKTATTLLVTALTAFAQSDAPIVLAEYEEPPALKAADILKPEFATGPNHRVMEKVTTFAGRNRYTVETAWGYFTAEGDAMLLARVAEANAMAAIQKLAGGEEYKEALKTAQKQPIYSEKIRAIDAAGAEGNLQAGLAKFIAGGEAAGAPKPDNDVDKLKRGFAVHLGTDPYSSNGVYQDQLDRLAWTSFVGRVTPKFSEGAVGSEAGLALTAENLTQNFQATMRDLSAEQLKPVNKRALTGMKVSTKAADAFLKNPAFSPTRLTAVVRALDTLEGVENRESFITLATRKAVGEPDALFCSGTAQLLAKLHSGKDKLKSLATLGGLPVALAADGRLIVALQWDTAFWNRLAEHFIERASAAKLGQTGPLVIAITGSATPRFRAELEKRKIGLITNGLAGPQR